MERRRRADRKRHNLERWMISYADFMTLLLAVFVVMYSISSMNSSKYQRIAEVLSSAFGGGSSASKISVPETGNGAQGKSHFQNLPAPVPLPVATPEEMRNLPPEVQAQIAAQLKKLDEAYRKLVSLLADLIQSGRVRVSRTVMGVIIDINATLLFNSGKADLTPEAASVIAKIGSVLKDLPYQVQVNGYTDNAPIHTAQFSSNWDLSALRAISVVKRFADDGVDPARMVGAGYGEYHPVASNDTPDGMAQNRRVSIVVVSPAAGKRSEEMPLVNGAVEAPPPSPSAAGAAAPAAKRPDAH